MKIASQLLVLGLVVTAYGGSRHFPLLDCRRAKCPFPPLCANPYIPPGECCPSCENSGCMFKGCVQFIGELDPESGSLPVQWKPEGCITCTCQNNNTLCGGLGCPVGFPPPPDPCFGYPTTTKPWECCPVCDFGISDTKCGVVPAQNRTFSLKSGDSICSETVVEHRCDKRGILTRRGKRFACEPVYRKRQVEITGCVPFTHVSYQDVVRCKKVQDNDLDVGCDLFID